MEIDKKWTELTPDEKRAERFRRWLSPPDIKFSSPEAEQAYKERVTRVTDAIQLREPDRVPVSIHCGYFPAFYSGISTREVIYDYEKLAQSSTKFFRDFDADLLGGVMTFPGRAMEALDFKTYRWPGHGLQADAPSHQYLEGEYMTADEYDNLINDPTDFWLRVYMPRIFGALEPFQKLRPFTTIHEVPVMNFLPFGMPDVQAALQALINAGNETMKLKSAVGEISRTAAASGYPSLTGGLTNAPFDIIGDTLRGTQGIMIDMFRQPDKLIEAIANYDPETEFVTVSAGGGQLTIELFKAVVM